MSSLITEDCAPEPARAEPPASGDVLDLELGGNDSGRPTVRGYLLQLLATLWAEEGSFPGKRPFGNSGWKYEVLPPIVAAGLAPDEAAADELVAEAIARMA